MPATISAIPRPAPAMLAFLYTDLRWGCPDIAWLYGRDAKTVHWWLRRADIPTRPRGSDARQHFKRGERGAFAGHRHSSEALEKIRAASVARGAVPYLRGGKHWLAGAAPQDNPRWLGGATPERQEFYRSAEWKAACQAVWSRANACCERCGRNHRLVNREEERFHVHHIVTFAVKEMRAVVENLALLCRPCHLFVHSKANASCEFLATPLRATEREAAIPDLFALMEA